MAFSFNPFKPPSKDARDDIYPTFYMRIMATLIDTVIMLLLLAPVFGVIKEMSYGRMKEQEFLRVVSEQVKYAQNTNDWPTALASITHMMHETGFYAAYVQQSVLQLVLLGVIYVFFWAKYGATPGKMLLRMRIVDAATLGRTTVKQDSIRFLGCMLSMLPLGLGLFWVVFDKKRQAWHDKIARTVVMYSKAITAKQEEEAAASSAPQSVDQ